MLWLKTFPRRVWKGIAALLCAASNQNYLIDAPMDHPPESIKSSGVDVRGTYNYRIRIFSSATNRRSARQPLRGCKGEANHDRRQRATPDANFSSTGPGPMEGRRLQCSSESLLCRRHIHMLTCTVVYVIIITRREQKNGW